MESRLPSILEEVKRLRHELHAIPEAGFQEHETSSTLLRYLEKVDDVEIKTGLADTGFTVTLNAGRSGPCIGFRADMDGLPISEQTGLPYASRRPGWMHACGHDGHSALQAGLVVLLAAMRDRLHGPVKFIFQPAEESFGGARSMIRDGALENPNVDMLFGLHGWPELRLGSVGSREGPFFGCTDSFTIRIQGKGGHAAFPHRTIDPVVVAGQFVSSAQSIVSRMTDACSPAVISFSQIQGGSTFNIVPDEVVIRGTIRCFENSLMERIREQLSRMAVAVAGGSGAGAEVEFHGGYPVLDCDPEATRYFRKVAGEQIPDEHLIEMNAMLAGEDFSYYGSEVPTCFWLLGVRNPDHDSWPGLHTSKYDFNDDALEYGIRLQASLALNFSGN